MGGSSSPPANTTTQVTNRTELPEEAKPLMSDMLAMGTELSQKPYEAYSDQMVAGLTPEHYAGLDMTTQRAIQGSPVMNSAQQQATNVFNDTYMNRGLDLANQQNPYQGVSNPYMGENPYLQQMIDKTSGDITRNFNDVVNPQLQSMDRASGAFGNSGVNQVRNQAYSDLAEQLGNNAANLRYQNYGQSANLAEQGINRDANLAGQQQSNTLAMYGNERNAQGNAMEFAPNLAQSDYMDAQNLLGVGDIYRDNSQQNLNYLYDQWQQEQNYPYQQFDILGSALANTVGGNASAITSAPNAYSSNSTANMIGTGLSGYGALQGLLQ